MSEDGVRLMRIGELARIAEVSTDTLRYYERLGLLEPEARSAAGYRLFGQRAAERVAFVRKAQAIGLTLEEVGRVIDAALDGSPPCDHVRATLRQRLAEVDRRMDDLRALRATLLEALDRPPGRPEDGACVCAIIEAHDLAGAPRGREATGAEVDELDG